MTELYEAHAPRSAAPPYEEIPSYGWSADEVARQERLSNTASGSRARGGPSSPRGTQGTRGTEGTHGTAAPRGSRPAGASVPPPRAPRHDDMEDTELRAQIVRGRRRMLWLLLVLTAVGVGLAYLRLAAWWVVIPPTVLLAGYLLLLREAAHADAEARQRRELAHATAEAHHATEAGTEAAAEPDARGEATPAPAGSEQTGPRADIINLSEHVGDQLYDQYADAKLRAVGD